MTVLLIEQNVGVAAELAGTTFVLANREIALETTGRQVATIRKFCAAIGR